jgi:hypothetical protein
MIEKKERKEEEKKSPYLLVPCIIIVISPQIPEHRHTYTERNAPIGKEWLPNLV